MVHKTGLEDYYVVRNQKKLRFGYTTGSCAAGAARGAAELLLGEDEIGEAELMTPKGILLHLELLDMKRDENAASCAVRKDAGDDPDTTNGILVYAKVEKFQIRSDMEDRIVIDGGTGVGRVTKPGLSQKIGEAAINPVPRAMILQAVEEIADRYHYEGGLKVTISVPEGEKIARKTFNPRLGIVGGISILGTSGIVEPMSEKALIDSIRVEMSQHAAMGEQYMLVTPGNYGADYLREHMALPFEKNIKCSNYVGETIDMAVDMGVKGILFISHIGKFVKVAAGIMNTHSHSADARMEVLCANAIRAGGDLACARSILQCNTTDEALRVLDENHILRETMKEITDRIQFYLDHRSYQQILLGAVIFSNEYGYLGQTEHAAELINKIISNSFFIEDIHLLTDRTVDAWVSCVKTYCCLSFCLCILDHTDHFFQCHFGTVMDRAYILAVFEKLRIHKRSCIDDNVSLLKILFSSDCDKIREQMDILDEKGIAYDYCPGVSAFCGAASALNLEYTLPEISQSVIITRMEGRTPVPSKESIQSFAAHQATMVVFLSTGMLEELSRRLIEGGYTKDTPAAIVYKATWPDEKKFVCTVGTLAQTAAENNITKTALMIIGDSVKAAQYDRSKLYDPGFTTEFREATK